MATDSMFRVHRTATVVVSAIAPIAAGALLGVFRENVADTNAVLVLVLLIVVAASTGIRSAGVVAAVTSAASFDYFLTAPYHTLNIADRADIETTVLLLLIGVAVSEIALWGRRAQAHASRDLGYLDGVIGAAATVAAGRSSTEEFIEATCQQIVQVLNIDGCRFDVETRSGLPTLDADGNLARGGRSLDVDRRGLPTDTQIALMLTNRGVSYGHLVLTAATRVVKPSRSQLRVAATLANQIAVVLAGTDGSQASSMKASRPQI